MKVLMLVDWQITRLESDSNLIQSPDKVVRNSPYWFFKYWPDSGIELDVIDICKVPLIHSFERRLLHFYVAQSLLAFLRRKKYDLIISHSAQSALVLAFLRSILKESLPLHVVIDVGCFNGGRANAAELQLIRKASRSLGGIITHSSIQSEYYDTYMPQIPYRFVPFGVDAEYFTPVNLQSGDFVLSFGSRARDYQTLIEAWKKVNKNRTVLKIIGIDKIENMDTGAANIEMLGRVPIQTLVDHIARARFVIIPLPFHKYSYGQMSFLQSMAMAKSCIVTQTPSSEDYLTDNKDALLVRPYDAEDLAHKIDLLLRDDVLNNDIARNARSIIETRYNEKNMAEALYGFISEII